MPIPDLSNKPGPGRPGWGPLGSYDFQFRVEGTEAVVIKANAAGGGSFTVQWPNGTTQVLSGNNASITAPDATDGIVSINNENDADYCDEFAIVGGKSVVREVISWGQNPWNKLQDAFKDCTNLTSISTTSLITDTTGNLNNLFAGCTSLTDVSIKGWNLLNGCSIEGLFDGCTNIEKLEATGLVLKIRANSRFAFRQVGSNVANGCEFLMSGLDFSTSISMGLGDTFERGMFKEAKIKPNSNFSNWNLTSSATTIFNFAFASAKLLGDNSTLNVSNWTFAGTTSSTANGFFQNLETSDSTNRGLNVDITNWNFGNVVSASALFKDCDLSTVTGLSTLTASNFTNVSSFFNTTRFLSIPSSDNLSSSFRNAVNVTGSGISYFAQNLGNALANESDWGVVPNLDGMNLSNSTSFTGVFGGGRFSTGINLGNVTFPTVARSYASLFNGTRLSAGNGIDLTTTTLKGSNFQQMFQLTWTDFVKMGPGIDWSSVTTMYGFNYLINYLRPGGAVANSIELPTGLNISSLSNIGLWQFDANYSQCQIDNFIRSMWLYQRPPVPSTPTLNFSGGTGLTAAPMAVRSKVDDLITAGWNFNGEVSPDVTAPFAYTGSFLIDTNITPTINTSGGLFSSSDVTVNENTGTFNTSTAGNVTIRYTITATGCYNEQVLSVVPPFTPFKFRVTGPISIKAQPAVAGQSFTIDWGDGSTPISTTGGASIPSNFTTAGTYDVQINAQSDATYCDEFAIVSGQTNVTEVLDWGESPWSNLNSCFKDCTSLDDISKTKLIAGTSCDQRLMFNGCTSLLEADIKSWDLTAGVNWDYGGPFHELSNLQKLDMTGMNIKLAAQSRNFLGSSFGTGIGTNVANGCEFLMSNIDWSTSTATEWTSFFRRARFAPTSTFANWVWPQYNINIQSWTQDVRVAGTDTTIDMSGWTTYYDNEFPRIDFSTISNNDENLKVDFSNLNVSNINDMNIAFYYSDVSQILGIETWGATAGGVNMQNAFIGNNFLKFTNSNNFSDTFIQSLTPTTMQKAFFQLGWGLTSNYGVAPNISNIDLSNCTSLQNLFQRTKFTNLPDIQSATFPSSAINMLSTFMEMRIYNSNVHFDLSNVSMKPSSAQQMFRSAWIRKITFGNNVDFSDVTSVRNMHYYMNQNNPDGTTTELIYPTNADFSSLADTTDWFIGVQGPTTGPLTTCQVDNLIRRFRATAYSNALNVNFYASQITEAPSVVRAQEAELVANGWTITENSTDATIPFEYTGDLEPDTIITPTNNTGSAFTGTFTSSDPTNIPVVASGPNAGLINTTNTGNATIRYTLSDGCYTEQEIVINFPYQIEVVIPEDDLVFPIYGRESADSYYDFTVDWGDGTSNSYSGAVAGRSISRTYEAAGTYQISIKGNAWPGATWSASQNKLNRITKLLSWGNTGLTSLFEAFNGSTALVQATPPDTIKWHANANPSLYRCFNSCSNLTTASIAGSDTTNVNGLYVREVFRNCFSLETLNIQNITIDNDLNSNIAYRLCRSIGTSTTDGTEVNLSNISFVSSTSTGVTHCGEMFMGARIKSLIADNWDFTGHSRDINLINFLTSAIFPTTNKTAYLRNWTFNSNNNLSMERFAEYSQLDEIDFSGNSEIIYLSNGFQSLYNSQVQRIKGLNKFKASTTINSYGLQRVFRRASYMTFSTTDSQYNFRDDFIHSGSNNTSLYLFMESCGNNAAVSSINSVPNMGNWGMDNITNLSSAFQNSKFSEYPTLYWNLSNVSNFYQAFYQAHPKGTNYTKDIDFRNCTFAPSTSTINVDMSRMFYRAYFQNIYFSSSEELPRNNKLSRTFNGLNSTNLESANLNNWDYGNIGSASEDLYLLQGYIGTLSATYYAQILARIRATAPTSVNSNMTFGGSRLEAEALHTSQQAGSGGWYVSGTTVINETGVGIDVSVGDVFYQSNQSQSTRYYYRITAVGSEDQITISSGILYSGNYWNILTSQAAKDRQYIVENLAIGFTDGIPIL